VNLSGNVLCGIDRWGEGVYNADGIKAIADSIAVAASISSIDLSANHLGPKGAKALAPAIRDSISLTQVLPAEISL
jgi:Ran GTPase-activating protein (RanGAP) involved in mRNA processing and transport